MNLFLTHMSEYNFEFAMCLNVSDVNSKFTYAISKSAQFVPLKYQGIWANF